MGNPCAPTDNNTTIPYYTGAAISQFMQIYVTSSIVLLNAGNGNRNNFWSRFIAVPHIQATKEERRDTERRALKYQTDKSLLPHLSPRILFRFSDLRSLKNLCLHSFSHIWDRPEILITFFFFQSLRCCF